MKYDVHSRAGFLFFGRKRPGFDPGWGEEVARQARKLIADTFPGAGVYSETVTDTKTMLRALEYLDAQSCTIAVVIQPTMSDGSLVPALAANWPHEILLWATGEKQSGEMISACSLVGAHTFGATLAQLGHRFEILASHPADPDCASHMEEKLTMLGCLDSLKTASFGTGYHAPGFIDMHHDPSLLKKTFGAQARYISTQDVMQALDTVSAQAAEQDCAAVKAMNIPQNGVDDEDLLQQSACYLAFTNMMRDNNLAGLSLREWPDLPRIAGVWPYIAFARLAEDGEAAACEGDLDGALSCFVAEKLGFGRTYLSDWLEHDEETICTWHGGACPVSLCQAPGEKGGPVFTRHFNSDIPAVIDASLKEGMPVTILRMWHNDYRYCITALEGETITPRRHLKGTNGLVKVHNANVSAWFEDKILDGFPHHITLVEGHHITSLKRFARLAGIRFV